MFLIRSFQHRLRKVVTCRDFCPEHMARCEIAVLTNVPIWGIKRLHQQAKIAVLNEIADYPGQSDRIDTNLDNLADFGRLLRS